MKKVFALLLFLPLLISAQNIELRDDGLYYKGDTLYSGKYSEYYDN